jgi:phosphatidylglycerophosphatase C
MNLALFDFDGTITFGDSFMPFVYLAARPRVALGSVLLSPLTIGYKLGLVPATRMRAAVAYVGFRGRLLHELRELGAAYGKRLPRTVRPEALAKIRWHQAQGDTVVVVSASLDLYLSAWCIEHGVELICTELESKGGLLTGRYLGSDCAGPEKARRVLERYDLSRYPVIYAYGDTPEDEELLSLASRRYFRWQERAR